MSNEFNYDNDLGVAPLDEPLDEQEPDPREQPMSDVGKFAFELARDLNRVYLAGMKAGPR